MRTWNDYKEHVAAVDPDIAKDIREAEAMSAIVKAMVEQRNAMGLSQRELAARCGIPQSSVARIESFKTMPNQIAHQRLTPQDGNATYRNYIIDAIYNMTPEQLEKGANYEVR